MIEALADGTWAEGARTEGTRTVRDAPPEATPVFVRKYLSYSLRDHHIRTKVRCSLRLINDALFLWINNVRFYVDVKVIFISLAMMQCLQFRQFLTRVINIVFSSLFQVLIISMLIVFILKQFSRVDESGRVNESGRVVNERRRVDGSGR